MTYDTGWKTRVQFPAGTMMGIFFSSPLHPDWVWRPPRLLSGKRNAWEPEGRWEDNININDKVGCEGRLSGCPIQQKRRNLIRETMDVFEKYTSK